MKITILIVVTLTIVICGFILWRLFLRNYIPYEFDREKAEFAFIFFQRRGISIFYILHMCILISISVILLSYVW